MLSFSIPRGCPLVWGDRFKPRMYDMRPTSGIPVMNHLEEPQPPDTPIVGPQTLCLELNGTQLLVTAMRAEDARLLLGDEDDCEGQELTYEPPPDHPLLVHDPGQTVQSTLSGALAAEKAGYEPSGSTSRTTIISPDRRRRNEAAAKRKRNKRVAAATSPYEGRSSKTRSGNIKKLEAIVKSSILLDLKDLPAAGSGSFVGLKLPATRKAKPPSPEQLVKRGFVLERWDGVTTLIVGDKAKRCFVVFVGRPAGKSWQECVVDAAGVLMKAREEGLACGGFKRSDLRHRRGAFLAFANGVSFGGGQKRPGNLVHPEKRVPIVQSLCSNNSVRRIAGFQSRCLATFAPKIFHYAQETLKKLFVEHPKLKPNFPNSIYPTITFNCGPDTACVEHVDHANAAHMLCAVTALGNYDPTKGGHLVLYPLKRFYEFPPGSTVLIPSAMVAHGNTPISKGESRTSITQYCPGGLLRWVEYGFQSAKSLLKGPGGAAKRAEVDGASGSRFEWALGLFSKVDELINGSQGGGLAVN